MEHAQQGLWCMGAYETRQQSRAWTLGSGRCKHIRRKVSRETRANGESSWRYVQGHIAGAVGKGRMTEAMNMPCACSQFAGALFQEGHFMYADEDGIIVSPTPLA